MSESVGSVVPSTPKSDPIERPLVAPGTGGGEKKAIKDAADGVSSGRVERAARQVVEGSGAADLYQVAAAKKNPQAGTDSAARQNIAALRSSEGFRKLGSEQQRRMLGTQQKAPDDEAFSRDLVNLSNGAGFQKVGGGVQNHVLDAMGRQAGSPTARQTIAGVASTPGFASLAEPEQKRMIDLLYGNDRQVNAPARAAAQSLIDDPAFRSASAESQATQLRGQIKNQPGLSEGIQSSTFIAQQTQYSINPPTAVENHPFASGPASAQRYPLGIDGRLIPVTIPTSVDPSVRGPTIEQVAYGISTVPKSSRDLINSVTVNPGANPQDAHWEAVYGRPKFRSYMTNGASGDVNLYANDHAQWTFSNALVHETGHTASQRAFGADETAPGWDRWRQAIARDGLYPSNYARASAGEDFSDTLTLYQGARNDPEAAADLRRLFPERFRILDTMF